MAAAGHMISKYYGDEGKVVLVVLGMSKKEAAEKYNLRGDGSGVSLVTDLDDLTDSIGMGCVSTNLCFSKEVLKLLRHLLPLQQQQQRLKQQWSQRLLELFKLL